MSETNPLVSIIVRTKDRPKLVKKALHSISVQTYRPLEVVLVNDGGGDPGIEGISAILGDVSLNYVRLENNAGRAHAANIGIEAAKGEYVGFLDDDDEFYPEHVTMLVSFLEDNLGFSCAYGDSEIVRRQYSAKGEILYEESKGVFKSSEFSYALLLFENYITLICSLMRKEVLEEIGCFDEGLEMFEDWDLFIRASEKQPFCHVPAVTSKYIQWSTAHQIAFIDRPEARNSYIKVLAKHRDKRTPEIIYQYFTVKDAELVELRNRVKETDALASAKAALEEELRSQNLYIDNLLKEKALLEADKKEVTEALERELREKVLRISEIENSAGWRFLEFYRAKVKARIFPLETRRERAYRLALKGLLTLQTKGPKVTFEKVMGKVRQRQARKRIRKEKLVLPVLSEEGSATIDRKVSMVIPTKNAGAEFKNILERVRGQQGIRDTEIIVVDSGSEDETVMLSEQFGARVIKIKPEEFSHGKVRNIGAEQSTGDYIVFMSQDVFPIGNECFYGVIKAMENDNKIAAATAKQIPRSDADLFACWQLWYYYAKLMDFSEDYVACVSPQELSQMSPEEKRRGAQLDNVFSCVRRDVFQQFKFLPVPYAEDLDLGLRLISGGYKLAFFRSLGVVHSHNREPSYYFKRSYVDIAHILRLLEAGSIRWDHFGVLSAGDILSSIYAFYLRLNSVINTLSKQAFGESPEDLIRNIKTSLQAAESARNLHGEKSVESLFEKILPDREGIGSGAAECVELLLKQYLDLLDSLGEFLAISGSIQGREAELVAALYKLFGVTAGSNLGNFSAYLVQRNLSDPLLESIAGSLGENI